MRRMDAGIAALLGVVVATAGTLGATVLGRSGQARSQSQQFRREAYSACAVALMERRAAAEALQQAIADGRDAEAEALLREALALRSKVMQRVGAVSVEGPEWAAHHAATAAKCMDVWVGGLGHALRRVESEERSQQLQFRYEDQSEAERFLDRFTTETTRVLHGRLGERRVPGRLRRWLHL
jgi:hypothetical protein